MEELQTIETVDTSPFKHLVMTIGELPTSFVDSMTYYECLAWLVNYIQNTVIPAVNNNAEAVEELQTAFTTLKNYVDNYFDNLDVQTEINNKLDEMAESGELTTLIGNYCQPILDQQNARITSLSDEISENYSELRNLIDAVTAGSPLVASSTAEMTDTTRVYVNTTDGKWYYYDGDSWEIGGTYQSTAIGAGTINYTMFDAETSKLLNYRSVSYTTTEGKYITTSGSVGTANNYFYTSPIELKAGETVVFYGNATGSVSMISEYDDGSYKSIVPFDTIGYYSYTAEKDMNIVISGRIPDFSKLAVFTIFDKNLEKDYLSAKYIKYDTSITDNAYVHYQTGVVYTHSNYQATDYITVVPNAVIVINGKPNLVATQDSSGCAFYDKNQVFISGVQYVVDDELEVTVPANAVYARFSIRKACTYFNIYYKNILKAVVDKLTGDVDNPSFFDLSVFTNFAVCGDSFASGVYAESPDSLVLPHHYSMSWPAMLARKYGFNLFNYSKGGLSTRTFITGSGDDYYLNNLLQDDPHEIYVLALERNDKSIYSEDNTYLGSITDITGHSLGNYPDTFYGNYATIIDSISQHAPNAKLVMFIADFLPTDQLGTNLNNAMKEIATHFGFPYLQELDDPFCQSPMYRQNRPPRGHPSAIQYNGLGRAFERLIAKSFVDNYNYYKYLLPTE